MLDKRWFLALLLGWSSFSAAATKCETVLGITPDERATREDLGASFLADKMRFVAFPFPISAKRGVPPSTRCYSLKGQSGSILAIAGYKFGTGPFEMDVTHLGAPLHPERSRNLQNLLRALVEDHNGTNHFSAIIHEDDLEAAEALFVAGFKMIATYPNHFLDDPAMENTRGYHFVLERNAVGGTY